MSAIGFVGEGLLEIGVDEPLSTSLRCGFGGDAANSAVMAAQCGVEARLCGRVGSDTFGGLLLDFWRSRGVDTQFVQVDERHATGAYVNTVTADGSRTLEYHRRESAGSLLASGDVTDGFLSGLGALHVTGITLALSDSSANAVRDSVARARARDILVSFAVNYRPKLEVALADIETAAQSADVVFMSRAEAEALFGDGDARAVWQALQPGVQELLITAGPHGATLVTHGLARDVAAPVVEAVDATGAGDALAGAYLAARLRGASPAAAAEVAVTLATASCTSYGCAASYLQAEVVEDMLRSALDGRRYEGPVRCDSGPSLRASRDRGILTPSPWNDAARLVCLDCNGEYPPAPRWTGCERCGGMLVCSYPRTTGTAVGDLPYALLPIPADAVPDLGQGRTPLVEAPLLGGGGNVWLKLEMNNPTGSHKDRFHACATAVAQRLGYRGVVTSSTGNHGAAAAAFAARVGLECVVCLHPGAPPTLRSQIAAYGATVVTAPDEVGAIVAELVAGGWYPSTPADRRLTGHGNPYGQEGYKSIAYEIFAELGQMPGTVAVPAAGGDTFYGIWRGFRDIHERAGEPMPLVVACQPAGAASLVASVEVGAAEPVRIPEPRSVALSLCDELAGRHAMFAVRSGAAAVAVSEEEIVASAEALAGAGFLAEPSSAAALAGLQRFAVGSDLPAPAVAVITSSALNWTSYLDRALGTAPAALSSLAELRLELQRRASADPRVCV